MNTPYWVDGEGWTFAEKEGGCTTYEATPPKEEEAWELDLEKYSDNYAFAAMPHDMRCKIIGFYERLLTAMRSEHAATSAKEGGAE